MRVLPDKNTEKKDKKVRMKKDITKLHLSMLRTCVKIDICSYVDVTDINNCLKVNDDGDYGAQTHEEKNHFLVHLKTLKTMKIQTIMMMINHKL